MRVQPVVGSFYQAEKADKNIPTTTGNKVYKTLQELVDGIVKKREYIRKNILNLTETERLAIAYFNKYKTEINTDYKTWFDNTFSTYEKGTPNFEAHHVLPINVLEKNKEFQALLLWAEKNKVPAFDYNSIENGMMLPKKSVALDITGHGNHPEYDKLINAKIIEIIENNGNSVASINTIKAYIIKVKLKLESDVLLGSTNINDITSF
jgi:hypothetical protein